MRKFYVAIVVSDEIITTRKFPSRKAATEYVNFTPSTAFSVLEISEADFNELCNPAQYIYEGGHIPLLD